MAERVNSMNRLLLRYVFIWTLLSNESKSCNGNKTLIPNQVYQPLGSCPCDLTVDICDVCCCCDADCFSLRSRFESCCLPGPFGGNFSFPTDCQLEITFLCVVSPPENNPGLGLFYSGKTTTPRSSLSFKRSQLTVPLSDTSYRRGSAIFTAAGEYFTIPQRSLNGQCIQKAPTTFLENFESECISSSVSCPVWSTDVSLTLKNGSGGLVPISVIEKMVTDLSPFLSKAISIPNRASQLQTFLCKNVTLGLNYTLYWNREGLSAVTVIRTFGNVYFDPQTHLLSLMTSATFVNSDITVEPDLGMSGYQIGTPVLGGVGDVVIQKAPLSTWYARGGNWACEENNTRSVAFGVNVTSGCLLAVRLEAFGNCSQLRDTVQAAMDSLRLPELVARVGEPDTSSLLDWVNVSTVILDSSSARSPEESGACDDVPSEVHIVVHHTSAPQREITAVQIQHKLTMWAPRCGAGASCQRVNTTRAFPLLSTVTFSEELTFSFPPKTKFQINFTELDCDRNDVCWPELLFPVTRAYTGEPYSQALIKGLVLVFLILTFSVLGSPWRQVRQAWNTSGL